MARGGRALQKARAASAAQERIQRTAKLGTGARFAALEKSIAASSNVPGRKKIQDSGAIAAMVGRKKYGNAAFQKMAARGRK